MARAISDNIASMVYNYTQNLETFFYIGLIVCALSLLAAAIMTEIHVRYIDSNTIKLNEAKTKQEAKRTKISIRSKEHGLIGYPKTYWAMIFLTGLQHIVVHCFYPNMSKFLQQNYGLSNTHAGHLSSIPYLTASIVVPIFGQLLAYFGESTYEFFFVFAFGMVFSAHSFLFFLNFNAVRVFNKDTGESSNYGTLPESMHWLCILPIFAIGIGHALNSTLAVPMVNKVVARKQHPEVLSTIKILEGCNISLFMYVYGAIRETTGQYDEVSAIIMTWCVVGMGAAFWLKSLNDKLPENQKPLNVQMGEQGKSLTA